MLAGVPRQALAGDDGRLRPGSLVLTSSAWDVILTVSKFYAFALLLCLCVMSVWGTRSCDGAAVCGLSDAGEACALLRRASKLYSSVRDPGFDRDLVYAGGVHPLGVAALKFGILAALRCCHVAVDGAPCEALR